MTEFIISFLFCTLGYYAYYSISESEKWKSFFINNHTTNNAGAVIFKRLTGVVILGLLPYVYFFWFSSLDFKEVGLTGREEKTMFWFLILSLIIIPLGLYNSPKDSNLKMYPMIRTSIWNFKLLLISAITWTAYLVAYEILFRGFLLHTSLEIIGIWPAIILNTAIYSIVHFHKGKKEMLGAIPLGIVLCLLVIYTGSILIAIYSHVLMALTNEWLSIYFHPEMKFSIFKK